MSSSTLSKQPSRPVWPWVCLAVQVLFLCLLTPALWFQFPEQRWIAIVVPLVCLLMTGALLLKAKTFAWAMLLVQLAMASMWWCGIEPRNDRSWAPAVAHGVEGQVVGSRVTLKNVRDFRWQTRDVAEERWISQSVDLDQLRTVDFIRTVWSSPHIAHTMVSFGFADGQYVVFSAEVRREDSESFSEIGGFFKQFELVLIAATEEDIVRLRTHARGEDVSIYPLNLPPEKARALFLSYVDLGNQLAKRPRFYQTITTNCTTVIWRLARHVQKGLPLDWRVLLSGHAQDYLYDIGAISHERPLALIKARAPVTVRARALPEGADFSQGIRAGLSPQAKG